MQNLEAFQNQHKDRGCCAQMTFVCSSDFCIEDPKVDSKGSAAPGQTLDSAQVSPILTTNLY